MNVFDYLFDLTKNIEKDFLLGSKETSSFKKLYNDGIKIASYLKETIGEGQNIVLISPNSVFFITAYLGIIKSGNTCVPLNFAIEQSNLDYILNTTECSTVFITESLKHRLKFNTDIHLIDEEEALCHIENQKTNYFNSDFNKNQAAEIIFTSGSTGEPKGVIISHQNIITNTNSIIEYLKLSSTDRMLVVLPFYYCYGLSLLHTHLKVGGSIILNNNFMFLGTVIQDLKHYNCTGFAGVPSHFQILLKKSESFKATEFPSLRYVTQAGGKLHDVFIKEFIEAFPTKEFYVMYGQTEATARLSYLPPELIHTKTSSIGKAIPNVELKIVNDEGNVIKANETGELLARGENIMLGYYKHDAETNLAIKDGWLYTGDIAKMDDDGYIYLVARKKEILKVGGKRVSPKEIEAVILSIPEIVDCTITGYDDDLLGEAILATIVIDHKIDESTIKEKILQVCSKNLSFYKIPQKIVFKTSIKISATGKKS
ncbi:acyl-CoA synthetase (AMP-forming)/AMP-acid ligase II [Mariniflexile fucanivorans]|uniref:Acyl-CoA synthetase (AMP-forming)/AMP-acid ligase II n=1 Tax=Mariniflexile fucanivorans TaxID=264023 RepID=A0A4R1RBG5_9FLAO|nr:AMP-binding protein [Mariniflexile fucanivorans]TCL63115.1 acyl-CoA synthetase (AMP-forming)/AMP-acid ligase II [Mariniflexile fucanivorans]